MLEIRCKVWRRKRRVRRRVHLRLESYLLAPKTTDPSRTGATASSRFDIDPFFIFIAARSTRKGTCSLTSFPRTRSRITRAMKGKKRDEAVDENTRSMSTNVGAGGSRISSNLSPRPALVRGVERRRRKRRQRTQKTKRGSRSHSIAPTLTHPTAVPRREVVESGA